jgi:hypothetical protein
VYSRSIGLFLPVNLTNNKIKKSSGTVSECCTLAGHSGHVVMKSSYTGVTGSNLVRAMCVVLCRQSLAMGRFPVQGSYRVSKTVSEIVSRRKRPDCLMHYYQKVCTLRLYLCTLTGGWKRLHNEELHNLYTSFSIIRVIKPRKVTTMLCASYIFIIIITISSVYA